MPPIKEGRSSSHDSSHQKLQERMEEVIRAHITAHKDLIDNQLAREAQEANLKSALTDKVGSLSSTPGVSIQPNGCKFISVTCRYYHTESDELKSLHLTIEASDKRYEDTDTLKNSTNRINQLQKRVLAAVSITITLLIVTFLITLLT